MEANGHDRQGIVCFCEFLGTMLFLFGIINTSVPIIIPFSLLASVAIWGDITGGHFNPAVTIGVFVTLKDKSKNFMFMIMIMISQILGGLAAIAVSYGGAWGKENPTLASLTPVNPVTGQPDNAANELDFSMDLQVVINEMMCTFIFVSVILMIKGEHTAGDRKGLAAAATVVLTLLCCIAATNKLGACFNPAVGIAVTTNSIVWIGKEHYLYHYLYAYTLGPAAGGLMAGFFYNMFEEAHKPVDAGSNFDASQSEKLVNYD